ncbi:hypothetical protein RHSIM_Rhsim05G0052900 [Rhododendron simsii]|uniref:Uncharacterized protein n=1 Tax=Rhododendron simsii TaxID=118357 RepID=A0A834GVJ0_RHOSS|nr:hypothetical protein RHSIM_Rhsim05G0052900 [Rhododendron simsii]
MGLEPNFIKPGFNPDSPVTTPLPHSFLLSSASGINQTNSKNPPRQNIEMVPLQPLTYTSLRDLLPASPPGSILWPTYNDRKDSWREIPIKDPLLQHAAWAYLRPMTAVRGDEDRGLLGKLADGCGGFFGCFGGFLDQVVWRSMNPALVSEDVDDDDVDFS